MNLEMWSKVGLLGVGLAVLSIMFLISRKAKTQTDYRSLFRIGVILLIAGTSGVIVNVFYAHASGLDAFFVLGLLYLAIGLIKRDTWKKAPLPP